MGSQCSKPFTLAMGSGLSIPRHLPSHKAVIFNCEQFYPSGDIWQSLETFLTVTIWEYCWKPVGRSKDVAKHSTMHSSIQQGIIQTETSMVPMLKNFEK